MPLNQLKCIIMNKVITNKKPVEEKVVYLEDLNDSDIVGISYDKVKLIIIKTKEGYTGVTNDLLRIDTNWFSETLLKYIKDFPGYSGVYKFDSVKEAFGWMSN